MRRALCRLDAIEDGGAKGFSFADGAEPREIFVVRRGDRVFAYVNSCPHIGTPLEFLPDRFLTADRTEILCATHGARFEIATGRCLAGPCRGKSLRAVSVCIEGGEIVLDALRLD
jgi:nitrite reductase/ring-hydroxylating ferredoxin subunit